MDFMILPALLAGLLGSLVLTAILCLLRRFLYVPFARRILLEKAIQRGNVVTARLVKSVDTAQEYGSGYVASNQEYGIYRYEFQGKTYKLYLCVAKNGVHILKMMKRAFCCKE